MENTKKEQTNEQPEIGFVVKNGATGGSKEIHNTSVEAILTDTANEYITAKAIDKVAVAACIVMRDGKTQDYTMRFIDNDDATIAHVCFTKQGKGWAFNYIISATNGITYLFPIVAEMMRNKAYTTLCAHCAEILEAYATDMNVK